MALVFFIIGLLIVAVSIAFAIKNRNNTKKWIASVTVGVFFSTFFMVIPTVWVKAGQSVEYPVLYELISSLFYSFKALGGRQDLAQIESIALTGWVKSLYIAVNYCSFVAAPVLASSLLLSFFGDTLQKLHYWVSFAPTCCVFSELNENSIALAESIKNEKGREILVFCKTKKVDEELLERARKLGGILLYKPCTRLNVDFRFKKYKYEFYLIAEDEDINIQDAETLIAKKDKLKNRVVIANVFTQGMTNVEILESMLPTKPFCRIFEQLNATALAYLDQKAKKKDVAVFVNVKDDSASKLQNELKNVQTKTSVFFCKGELQTKVLCNFDDSESFWKLDYSAYQCVLEAEDICSTLEKPKFKGTAVHIRKGILKNKIAMGWTEEPFQMRFVDEISLFCNQQILDHPLYLLPNNKKEIIVMIAGCGYWGMHMLKTIVWAGQIDGYTLKIHVYDKEEADVIKGAFYQQCPELKQEDILPEDTIKFIKADFLSDRFEEQMKESLDATYVCVATGDDALNLTVSEELYRIFRRNAFINGKPNLYTPRIFARVRKNTKSGNYSDSSYLEKRRIHLFGTADSFFSRGTLFNTQLEKLAFVTHLCYCGALDQLEKGDKNDVDYCVAEQQFYSTEYNRRSSLATALHFGAKIQMCSGKVLLDDPQNSDQENRDPFDAEIDEYKTNLTPKTKEWLMENEHVRWNCFTASEGWRRATDEQMETYIPYTKSHKDSLSKSHPCIRSYHELTKLDDSYEKHTDILKKRNCSFQEEDEKIIVNLPKIVKAAKKLYEENK